MHPEDAARRQPPDRDRAAALDALREIVGRLESEAENRVARRNMIEQRWLADLRQHSSEYEPSVVEELKKANKSLLFINQTQPKTNACEARLSDMLFPTDDDNWAIRPTPVPELTQGARRAVEQAKALVAQANEQMGEQNPAAAQATAAQAQEHAETAATMKAHMDEARKRAEAMADEMRDQLAECSYNIAARDAIRDACRLGTGIMLGPVGSTERARRSWRREDTGDGNAAYRLNMVSDPRPCFYRVDPWGWFPETDATRVSESASFFERNLMTPKELRALARQPGFDKDAIRTILGDQPGKSMPAYLSQLRAITGENTTPESKYIVWVYRGPLTTEDLETICACTGQENVRDAAMGSGEIDPLTEVNVVIWFCQTEILKFGIHHLDSGEALYSVFNLQKDDSSIWGFGIPYIMRNSQKAMNAAWRMMMDNAALSSGPQIEIDTDVVEPEDGTYTLLPRKVWRRKKGAGAGRPGIRTYEISSHQPEMQAIIALAKEFIDDETAISVLAQGEQGAHTTQTANGMALLMNAVNVVFRRMVKNFDDDMTVPNIRRLYDWNMQFSKKDHIKGDFEVDARGSSVLLVREIQSQNLMILLGMTANPTVGMMLKVAPLLRKTVQSMMIPADEVVVSDEELQQIIEAQANQPPPPDPNQIRAESQERIAHERNQTTLQVAQLRLDEAMKTLATKYNMTIDQLRAMLEGKRMDVDSKERILAAEVAVEARNPGGGGSGGYVSAPPG